MKRCCVHYIREGCRIDTCEEIQANILLWKSDGSLFGQFGGAVPNGNTEKRVDGGRQ